MPGDQAAVQRGRRHVGDHRPGGLDPSPCSVRTPTARPSRTTTSVARQPSRTVPPAASKRRAIAAVSMPAPPVGTGEARLLAHHDEDPAHHPGAGRVHGDVGVGGVAGEEHLGAVAGEVPVRDAPGRRAPASGTGRPAARTFASAPRPFLTGGNGESSAPTTWSPIASQPRHSSSQASPSPGARASSPAVSSAVRCSSAHAVGERRAGHGGATRRARAARARAAGSSARPPRGCRTAERVVHEAVPHPGVAADGAADPVLRLEQHDVPPRVREQVGRDEPVGSTADDDGVGAGHATVVPLSRRYARPRRGRAAADHGSP